MNLLHELHKFGEKNPRRKQFSDRCIDFFQKHGGETKIFERDFFDDGHFTAGVLAFNKDKTKVLLMKSKKSQTWQQFGGHADGDRNLRNVALREFEEESGIHSSKVTLEENIGSVDVHIVPARNHPKHGFELEHYHYDVNYFGIIEEDSILAFDDPDVDGIRWISLDDISRLDIELSSGMKTMIEEYFQNQNKLG